GLVYLWLPQLGGRRKALAGSANGAWRNAAFQGYADHLASAEFAEGLALALELAARRRTALMCAEAVWWRCHRRLISDLLVHRGIAVEHILAARHVQQHELNPSAVASGDLLVYPPAQAGLFPQLQAVGPRVAAPLSCPSPDACADAPRRGRGRGRASARETPPRG